MSEFIERMARAAYSKWIEGVESLELPWEQMPQDFRDRMIGAQRAALEAAREPTEEMINAVRRSAPYDRDIEETWPIAIDEALQ